MRSTLLPSLALLAACFAADGAGASLTPLSAPRAPAATPTPWRTLSPECRARDLVSWPAPGHDAMSLAATSEVILLALASADWTAGQGGARVVLVDGSGAAREIRVPRGRDPIAARDGAGLAVIWPGADATDLAPLATTFGSTPVRQLTASTYFRFPYAAQRQPGAWLITEAVQESCFTATYHATVSLQREGAPPGATAPSFTPGGTRLTLVPRPAGGHLAFYAGHAHPTAWRILDDQLQPSGPEHHDDAVGCETATAHPAGGALLSCLDVALHVRDDATLAARIPLPGARALPIASAATGAHVLVLARAPTGACVIRAGDDHPLECLGTTLRGPPFSRATASAMVPRDGAALLAWLDAGRAHVREYDCATGAAAPPRSDAAPR